MMCAIYCLQQAGQRSAIVRFWRWRHVWIHGTHFRQGSIVARLCTSARNFFGTKLGEGNLLQGPILPRTLGPGLRGRAKKMCDSTTSTCTIWPREMPMHDLFAAAELNVFFGMRLGKVADGCFFCRCSRSNGSITCVFIYAGNPHDFSIPAGVPQHLFPSPREPCKFGFFSVLCNGYDSSCIFHTHNIVQSDWLPTCNIHRLPGFCFTHGGWSISVLISWSPTMPFCFSLWAYQLPD